MKKYLIKLVFSEKERSIIKKVFADERLRLFKDTKKGYCESRVLIQELIKIEEKL